MATGSVSAGTGLVSGTDYDSLISKLMQVEQQPLTMLQNKVSDYKVQLSAYGTLKSDLSSLQTAVEGLTSTTDGFNQLKGTSGDTGLFTVSVTNSAATGSYDITVNSLAQQHKLTSVGFGTSEAVGAGTLHLQLGTGTPVDVTVGATDTISDIATKINSSGAGITATVINDGTNNVLTLKSNNTGTANAMTITTTDADGNNTDASGLSRLYYAGGTGDQMTLAQKAQDASITLDGVTVVRSSNTISDALSGVTLNLKAQSTTASGSQTTLTVGADADSIKNDINSFISAYNTVVDYIASQQKYTAATGSSTSGTAGTLLGDSTTNSIRNTLRNILSTPISGGTGDIQYLSDMGITLDSNNHLVADSTKLDSAVANDLSGVKAFFTQAASTGVSEGFAGKLSDALTSWTDSFDGTLTTKTNGIQSTIDQLTNQEDAMQTRLDMIEANYRSQFNTLETLLSTYKTTASSIDSLVSSMSNLNAQISGK